MRGLVADARVQPVVNLMYRPQPDRYDRDDNRLAITNSRWFGSGGTGTYSTRQGIRPDGAMGWQARKTWTAAPNRTDDSGFDINRAGTSGYPVEPGTTYAFSAFLRASTVQQAAALMECYDSAGVSLGRLTGPWAHLAKNAWLPVSGLFVVPPAARYVKFIADIRIGGELWQPGDTLDCTMPMVTLGPTLHPYLDGDSPGARWLGAANASPSVGYPRLG